MEKLLASTLALSLIWTSLPPGCLAVDVRPEAQNSRSLESIGRSSFAQPRAIGNFHDFANILLEDLSGQSIRGSQGVLTPAISITPDTGIQLAESLQEAAKIFKEANGSVSVQWSESKRAFQFNPHSSLNEPDGVASNQPKVKLADLRDEELASSLAHRLSETTSFSSAQNALRAFFDAAVADRIPREIGGQGESLPRFHWVGPEKDGLVELLNPETATQRFQMKYWSGAQALPQPKMDIPEGKRPVFILVGGGKTWNRDQDILPEVRKVIRQAQEQYPGLELWVLDEPGFEPEGVDHFIPGALKDHTLKNGADNRSNMDAVASRVIDDLNDENAVAVAVHTYIQDYVKWVPSLQSAVRQENNPKLPILSEEAVKNFYTKSGARKIINQLLPYRGVPARSIGDLSDPDIERKAIEGYREITSGNLGGVSVVLKTEGTAGKVGTRIDGLDSEKGVLRNIRSIKKEVKTFWKKGLNKHKKVASFILLMESKIDALAEYDIEFATSLMITEDTCLVVDMIAAIIGNATQVPGSRAEKSMLFPGLFSRDLSGRRLQLSMILGAFEESLAVFSPNLYLPPNIHDEQMLTGDPVNPGSLMVEKNLRAAGKIMSRTMTQTGFMNVYEWGARGSLGLPLNEHILEQPAVATSLYFMLPQWTGKIVSVEVPAKVRNTKGVEISIDVQPGRQVFSPAEGQYAYDDLGLLKTSADTPEEANRIAREILPQIKFKIRSPIELKLPWIGKIKLPFLSRTRVQTGEAFYLPADQEYVAFPKKVSPVHQASTLQPPGGPEGKKSEKISSNKPDSELTAEEWKILDEYEAAQLAWVPIFPVYNPSFSAFMLSILGVSGIGVGALGYTLALILATPFSSVISGWMTTRKVYSRAWPTRIFIYTVGFGLALWALLPLMATPVLTVPFLGPLVWLHLAAFGLSFLDGLAVSFSSSRDIDQMGLYMVAKEYGFGEKISPQVQNYFDTRYSAANARAQFIYPLSIGLLAVYGTMLAWPVQWVFLGLMGGVFLIKGSQALYHLSKLPKSAQQSPKRWQDLPKDFKFGMSLAWNVQKFRDRLILEGLERSWWDGLRKVLYLMLGTYAFAPNIGLSDGSQYSAGNLIGNVLLAASSLGFMVAARILKSRWKAPLSGEKNEYPYYRHFFPLIAFAGLITFSFAGANFLASTGLLWAGAAVAILGAFLFGLTFEPASLGAGNLMKKAAVEHGAGTRISGISTAVRQTFSSLIVLALSALFQHYIAWNQLESAILGAAAFFTIAGVISWLVGRRLPSGSPYGSSKPDSSGPSPGK